MQGCWFFPMVFVVELLGEMIYLRYELFFENYFEFSDGPVGWGCKIHWLHLWRGVKKKTNERPGYNTKQSDGEATEMLELWRMRSAFLLPSLPCPFWSGVVAPDRVLSMGQIELNCVLMLNLIFFLNRTVLKFKLCTYDKLNYLQ